MDKKEQKEKIIGLGKLVAQASKLYADCLQSPDDFSTKIQQILTLETEGDTLQSQLDDHFANEKNIPYLALDRANLVRRLDDVLDTLAVSARTLEAFKSGMSDKFQADVKPIADCCVSMGSSLSLGVETIYSSFTETLSVTKQIEESRDAATSKAFELETQLFKDADPASGWKEYEASTRIVKQTMKIIIRTKEASELLQIMSLKFH
ncbi:MAG: DUF47 family protein [Candidatus Kariarchaeaceae archaeon]|jgi:uncharacterized protein Yka (UPF0111/DUF47 family)